MSKIIIKISSNYFQPCRTNGSRQIRSARKVCSNGKVSARQRRNVKRNESSLSLKTAIYIFTNNARNLSTRRRLSWYSKSTRIKKFSKGDISITSGSSLPPSTPLSASPPPQRRGKHSNQSLSRRSSNLHFPEPPKSIGVAIDPPDNKRSSKVRYQHYFFFMKMWSNSLIFW